MWVHSYDAEVWNESISFGMPCGPLNTARLLASQRPSLDDGTNRGAGRASDATCQGRDAANVGHSGRAWHLTMRCSGEGSLGENLVA
jgi:hypothetical protein